MCIDKRDKDKLEKYLGTEGVAVSGSNQMF